eukprot:SAG31_NODE_31943_length_362_cov_0.768061_1_plen_64_part_10
MRPQRATSRPRSHAPRHRLGSAEELEVSCVLVLRLAPARSTLEGRALLRCVWLRRRDHCLHTSA